MRRFVRQQRPVIPETDLIELLTHVQHQQPERNLLLVMRTGPTTLEHRTPEEIAVALNKPDFPYTEAAGAVTNLCWVALQLVDWGEGDAFAVVVRRDRNRWGLFHAMRAPGGNISVGEAELAWKGVDRTTELEQDLPLLRQCARLTKEEEAQQVMSVQKSAARGQLRSALTELAELYEVGGQPARARAVWDELEPMFAGGLRVINPGWSSSAFQEVNPNQWSP